MKAKLFKGDWMTYIVVIAIMFTMPLLSSCSGGGENDPISPVTPPVTPPTPVVSLPVATLKPSIVGLNKATLAANIIPNDNEVTVSFLYKKKAETDWITSTLPTKYSGKDSVKVTFEITNLTLNTEYEFLVKVVNKAGEVTSDATTFKTYAVSDYDGNLYHLVTIEGQTWLQENFKGTHFANGDEIPNVTSQDDWAALTTPGYCYYDNDPKNGVIYGGLYNWYVASDSRGLIKGMHSPKIEEWDVLLRCNDTSLRAAPPIWNGNNKSGFTALKGGYRGNKFDNTDGWFWSSTAYGNISAAAAIYQTGGISEPIGSKACGMSIRLIRN